MARRSKMSVQKRKRERDRAERAALKRETRSERQPRSDDGSPVATTEDLEGYGILPEPESAEER